MSIKRTIITTILALAVVAVAIPAGSAQALTVQDLNTQIAQLQAQLAQLGGQEQAGNTTGVLPTNCIGVDFDRNLSRSMVGNDVKCMQSILNQLNVNVANFGAGSPGQETTFFGGATRAAVIRFQTLFSISPANGTVGAATLAKLNSLLITWRTPAIYPAGCTSNSGYSSTTGLSCAATGLPAGCTSNSGYSSTTGLSCAMPATTLPAGCTSTAGYSPVTGANCATGAVTTTLPAGCTSTAGYSTTTGVSCATGVSNQPVGLTGFIDVSTLSASPANNTNVTATSNVPVIGFNVKAINANMTVSSLKVQLAVTKLTTPAVAEHPATLVNKLYVYDGSTLLGTYGVDYNSVYKTSAGDYYVILSGFNFMVPANTTKVLTINADFAPALETNRTLVINLYDTSSVGATDGTGATRTSGVPTARTYTVSYNTVGTSTLTGTSNVSTPISASVNVNATDGTPDVPMLVFDAKSTIGNSKLTDLVFSVVGTGTGISKMSGVKLYDGSTPLGSASLTNITATTATATFNDLAIDIAKDATKTLTVKADFAAGVTNGDTAYITITPSTQFTYTTPNLSNGTPVGTIITGKTMYLYNGKAAAITFISGTSTPASNPTQNASTSNFSGVITFQVNPTGGQMTELTSTTVKARAYDSTGTPVAGATYYASVSPDQATPDGTTATVTVALNLVKDTTLSGFYYFKVYEIDWNVGGTTASQTWGLDDFKTPAQSL